VSLQVRKRNQVLEKQDNLQAKKKMRTKLQVLKTNQIAKKKRKEAKKI